MEIGKLPMAGCQWNGKLPMEWQVEGKLPMNGKLPMSGRKSNCVSERVITNTTSNDVHTSEKKRN